MVNRMYENMDKKPINMDKKPSNMDTNNMDTQWFGIESNECTVFLGIILYIIGIHKEKPHIILYEPVLYIQ